MTALAVLIAPALLTALVDAVLARLAVLVGIAAGVLGLAAHDEQERQPSPV
jgi:hypothetical protein